MRAHAAVRVECVDGRPRIAELRSEPPLTLRRTGPYRVHLVGSAAGPLRGDELRLSVHVGPSARLELRGLGAMLALGGDAPPATLTFDVRVEDGGTLHARLPPTILATDSLLHTSLRVELAETARLLWSEVTVLGRHAEPGGAARQSVSVTRAGRPILRTSTDLTDPLRYATPAVLGDARALGYAIGTPSTWDSVHTPGCRSAIHRLPGATLLAVLGADPRLVTEHLDRIVG